MPVPLFAVCQLSIVPVRLEVGHSSEITSQVRCGEGVEILDTSGNRARVRVLSDDYEGWIDLRQFTPPAAARPPVATCITDDDCCMATCGGRRMLLPLGTPLPNWENGSFLLGAERWSWPGQVRPLSAQQPPDTAAVLEYAHRYLHTAYLWGGRSLFGIDCSGLVQAVFQAHGQRLLRDSIMQMTQGTAVKDLAAARPGDLVFFNCAGDVGRHVGLLLSCGTIIHASAMVRVDDITDAGIRHRGTGEITHHITAIRRFF